MKPKQNSKPPNENGDLTITTETTKNVNENECEGISKWSDPEFVREYNRKYRQKHNAKLKEYNLEYRHTNLDRLKKYLHNYHKENTGRIHTQKRGYYQQNKKRIQRKNIKNRDYRNAYSKVYYKQNKPRLIIYACKNFKRRYKSDILFRVKHLLRTRLGNLCKIKRLVKSKKTMDLLGCDLKFFKSHIESQFGPGMRWDNHGRWGWHIDHIMPLDMAKTSKDMESLCHYKNLQPLWWYDNLSKSGTIPHSNKRKYK